MRNKQVILIIIGAVALFCVAFLLYAARTAIYTKLNDWKLIPQPEQFTELYFENAPNLPRETVAGQPISFSFTIHNVEGTMTVYPYEVYFEYPNGEKIVFQTSTVTLANDATTTIAVSHTFIASNLKGEVIVNLPTQNDQQIDFLLPDTN